MAVFHKIQYNIINDNGTLNNLTVDSIHAQPARHDCHSRNVPAMFDAALINLGSGGNLSVEGRYNLLQSATECSVAQLNPLMKFEPVAPWEWTTSNDSEKENLIPGKWTRSPSFGFSEYNPIDGNSPIENSPIKNWQLLTK
ncbi:hypothetical protein F4604DRAFT_1686543 [Suillus subluteus]|nr:hypothetical protein F4604DRAFT_1686543 [Suillus subluteus]